MKTQTNPNLAHLPSEIHSNNSKLKKNRMKDENHLNAKTGLNNDFDLKVNVQAAPKAAAIITTCSNLESVNYK